MDLLMFCPENASEISEAKFAKSDI